MVQFEHFTRHWLNNKCTTFEDMRLGQYPFSRYNGLTIKYSVPTKQNKWQAWSKNFGEEMVSSITSYICQFYPHKSHFISFNSRPMCKTIGKYKRLSISSLSETPLTSQGVLERTIEATATAVDLPSARLALSGHADNLRLRKQTGNLFFCCRSPEIFYNNQGVRITLPGLCDYF